MTIHENHLAAARRHVIEGEQRVAQQMMRIEKIAAAGLDTADAERFLQTLIQSLALMQKHLQLEIAESFD